ncbi:phospholipase A [Echinococcus multilocularis]|uniref:Phospholipase A n=1 Tax=Echinococcus multilocularis TaxID=6211 RepID=A0A068Y1X9_ECHMU|nr:phospholipase A [Echinococcus multilocularis]
MNALKWWIKSKLPHPLIMIPGDGGSQAYAQFRDHISDPFQIWIDLRYLISPRTFSDYFKLKYNNETRRTEENDKAIITFPGWGETWSIDNLDSRPHSVTKYFQDLTTAFTQNPYYVPNSTIRGAPFDFRRAPNENGDFNPKLKHLVEETFHNGKDQRVVLLGHSMGALYALSFLKNQSDAWKRQYIKAFVAVSAPLGGSIKALKMEASGDNFGIYFDNPLWYREVQRSMSSLAFLLPDPRLWSNDEVVIYTPVKNYTVHNYKEFFFDIGFPEGFQMYEDAKLTVDALAPPTGVNEVYCIYSSAVRTPGTLIYSSTFPDAQPDVVYETDGDGTVNVRSLSVCQSWANNSGGVDQVETLVIPGVNHLSIILDSRFINRAKEISNAEQPMPVRESFWHALLHSFGWRR